MRPLLQPDTSDRGAGAKIARREPPLICYDRVRVQVAGRKDRAPRLGPVEEPGSGQGRQDAESAKRDEDENGGLRMGGGSRVFLHPLSSILYPRVLSLPW